MLASYSLFARTRIGGSYWTNYFPAVVAFGLVMAIRIAPLVRVVMGTVDQRLWGLASGINNAISRTAMLLSMAVYGVIAFAVFDVALDERLDDLGVSETVVKQLAKEREKLAGADLPEGLDAEQTADLRRAIDESFVSAFRGTMLIAAAMAFASAAVALVVIERRLGVREAPAYAIFRLRTVETLTRGPERPVRRWHAGANPPRTPRSPVSQCDARVHEQPRGREP